MAVVMASSDMPEILGLTHRALVMRDGAFVGRTESGGPLRAGIQERVFRLAAGLDPGDPSPATRPAGADGHSDAGSSRSGTPTTVSPTTKEDVR